MLEAYVDGSYCRVQGRGSWALVIMDSNLKKVVHSVSGEVTNKDALALWNVGGELAGAMRAGKFAKESNIPIVLCYDYEGIGKWLTGEWKAKKKATQQYREFMIPLYNKGLLQLRWGKGHSGIEGNELADKLAKEVLGI